MLKITSKIETLAKVYLKTEPAYISDETKSKLCDWLMSEFQQLPLNVQFSDYTRYETAIDILKNSGLKVQQCQTGAMKLLNPINLAQDEGITGTAKICWNLLTQKAIRERILKMNNTFNQYSQYLGYIILYAVSVSK
jgi:hypothetical protein